MEPDHGRDRQGSTELSMGGATARIGRLGRRGVQSAGIHHGWAWSMDRFVRRKPLGAAGAVLLIGLILAAVFAPWLAPYDPLDVDPGRALQPPNLAHLAGTDNLGRDVLSRLIYGARISLYVGVVAVLVASVVGSAVGIISGFLGGTFDLVTQRVIDSLQAFPLLILAMTLVALLGARTENVILALAIVLIPGTARVMRGATLSVRENLFVEAARSVGATNIRILVRHILPNVSAPIIIIVSVELGTAILVEASLSFLGLGPPPPTPTWGSMLSGAGRTYMESAPWLLWGPAIAISLAILSLNLFGDALRDVLDPRLRSR